MSQGLGRIEKAILKALKKCGDLSIDELAMTFRYGFVLWEGNTDKLDEIGTFVYYDKSSSVWQSTARAVRTLTRKGLVIFGRFAVFHTFTLAGQAAPLFIHTLALMCV